MGDELGAAPVRLATEASTRVLAGRVVKPHGIRGEVVVAPLSDRPERFERGSLLYSEDRTLIIVSARPHQGRLLVHFAEVADRTAAERLRGARLEADPLEYDEEPETYLASELVGMHVVTEDGRELGVVEALVELPSAAAYDLLEVAPPEGRTWLLPAAEEYVTVEEDETGCERLVLQSPPEGLVPEEILRPGAGAAVTVGPKTVTPAFESGPRPLPRPSKQTSPGPGRDQAQDRHSDRPDQAQDRHSGRPESPSEPGTYHG